MSAYNLKEIYEYANEVLGKEANPEFIDGAINWGDLSCTDVVMSMSVHGETWVRLVIEEADPHNPELRQFMYDKLWKKFPDVDFEVCPEW